MQHIVDADKLKGIIIITVFCNWSKSATYLDKIISVLIRQNMAKQHSHYCLIHNGDLTYFIYIKTLIFLRES